MTASASEPLPAPPVVAPGEPTTAGIPHSVAEDVLGILTGTFVASFGLFLLRDSGAVTGGTAGLALLLSYTGVLPFGVLFFVVNAPFFALAVWKKGWRFTIRTAVSVALVSLFSTLHPAMVTSLDLQPVYGVLAGNLLVGIGLLVVFRHGSSLGGFNIVALIAQERFGFRAGYAQMILDVIVILLGLTVVSVGGVVMSALGAVLLNLVLALNHRPGRYTGI
ncbi:YitT family protein [Clavibacter sp. VKM Ac-2873]|uniref:YitT family protein n=1 Tax=Clavibacter sp. VKM Ac-2873 TaxID=2783813 RepID=UPI00188A3E61|nr:YitT family protein [Clavibacter sp. VKM Ac-2873]MBF4617088.1 YitT family protein [Clavibacter sp. VKM Ac-2873]